MKAVSSLRLGQVIALLNTEGGDALFFVHVKKNGLKAVESSGDTRASTFAYNALDQRVKKVDSDGVVNFIYDGAGILMETNQSGQILGAYTNGLMGPISKRNAQNEYGYLMTDALGTVREIVDANKDVKMSYKYDIFGAIRSAQGEDPFGIPQTFTGKELDTDSGLHYFGARYYDSSLGRFITADSWTWGPDDERVIRLGVTGAAGHARAGEVWPGLLNLYVYCVNSPLGLRDPSGHLFYILLIVVVLLIAVVIGIMLKTGTKISNLREWIKNFFIGMFEAKTPTTVPPKSAYGALGAYGEIDYDTRMYLVWDTLFPDEDNPYKPSQSLRTWKDNKVRNFNPDAELCPDK